MSVPKFLVILLLATVFLAGCGAQGGQAPAAPGGVVEVEVTLSDFAIESSLTEFQTGVAYRFVVTNEGAVPHEFMIMPVLEEGGGMEMGELDEMALMMIEEDELSSGATQTVEFTFTEAAPAGALEFACWVPGHHEAGMFLPITVE